MKMKHLAWGVGVVVAAAFLATAGLVVADKGRDATVVVNVVCNVGADIVTAFHSSSVAGVASVTQASAVCADELKALYDARFRLAKAGLYAQAGADQASYHFTNRGDD